MFVLSLQSSDTGTINAYYLCDGSDFKVSPVSIRNLHLQPIYFYSLCNEGKSF